ncbi:hypothetical protein [Spirosoma telluris]|uniref:hypothetical protein n=1 Tax=Spirosoma telluris TaxID=2183553 RepID=UPI0013147C5E
MLFIKLPNQDHPDTAKSHHSTKLEDTATLSKATHQPVSAPFSATNDCGLTMKTKLSGCYSVSGISKATLSAEVSWTAIPDGATITIQVRNQTKTITLRNVSTATDADVRSPQVVAFEIEADSAPTDVVVTYGNCVVTDNVTAPAPCPVPVCTSLGGTVFKDFNADGIHQDGESTGLPDIIVKAITTTGTSYTAATDSIGNYTIAVPAGLILFGLSLRISLPMLATGRPMGRTAARPCSLLVSPIVRSI